MASNQNPKLEGEPTAFASAMALVRTKGPMVYRGTSLKLLEKATLALFARNPDAKVEGRIMKRKAATR